MKRESLTPAERVLRARMGAYALHARYDPRVTTVAARQAFDRRFLVSSILTASYQSGNDSAVPKLPARRTSRGWRFCQPGPVARGGGRQPETKSCTE